MSLRSMSVALAVWCFCIRPGYCEGPTWPPILIDSGSAFCFAMLLVAPVVLLTVLTKKLLNKPANPYGPALVVAGLWTLVTLISSWMQALGSGICWLLVLEGFLKSKRGDKNL